MYGDFSSIKILKSINSSINAVTKKKDKIIFCVLFVFEIFNVYKEDGGEISNVGKVGADPDLRVLAAKTLLGKCVPDLKAVEVTAQIEERKVLDISRLSDNDLNTIERVLEHAVIETSESGKDEEISEGVYEELVAND